MHLWVYHKSEHFPVSIYFWLSFLQGGFIKYAFVFKYTTMRVAVHGVAKLRPTQLHLNDSNNTALHKLNGFPCLASQYTSLRLWVSVSLLAKQWGWMGYLLFSFFFFFICSEFCHTLK